MMVAKSRKRDAHEAVCRNGNSMSKNRCITKQIK